MLTKVLLPGLFFALAACPPPPSGTQPSTPATPTAVDCSPTNDVLFESISESRREIPPLRTITTVYATGMWEVTAGTTASRKGCMKADDVAKIESDLSDASWEISHDKFRCGAAATLSVSYSSRGRPLWTEEVCSGMHLDDDSKDRLDRIIAIVSATTQRH